MSIDHKMNRFGLNSHGLFNETQYQGTITSSTTIANRIIDNSTLLNDRDYGELSRFV